MARVVADPRRCPSTVAAPGSMHVGIVREPHGSPPPSATAITHLSSTVFASTVSTCTPSTFNDRPRGRAAMRTGNWCMRECGKCDVIPRPW